jgi:type IV secretion system protein VirD4
MKQINVKKLLLPNLPYVFIALFATKLGQAARLSPGADFSAKALHIMEGFAAAFQSALPSFHPIDLCVGVAAAIAIRLAVYIKGKNAKKYRKNVEYGSARWGNSDDIRPYVDPVFENNIILTQTERLTMNSRPKDPKTARNKNVLVVGGSGSGKTRFFIKPNLMQCTSDARPVSFVVTDPKGGLICEVGHLLRRNKYRIKVVNTINFKKSMHYNPFAYIHSEKDILKLVTTLIANTQGDSKSGDDFWRKAETLLYTALIGYLWYEAPVEEQNFATLIEMINTMEVREDDEEFKNPVDLIFEELASRDPGHFAVRQYAKYRLAAGKTAKSILISCGARLAPFDIQELREITAYDELELDTLGDRKTALFIIISDTDDTFNFLASMIYTQLFNLLCDKADDVYGGRLPVHVRCLIDECANIGQIPKLEKLMATIRSREISACLVLQAQSQLKALYKDNCDTIIGNCDSSIFLGGKEPTTLKELSAALGKETIDTFNTGESRGRERSHSLNYQKLGKELMSQDELAVMNGGKCILQLRGVRPFLSDKYDVTQHPNYKYLSDANPKNAFDVEKYLSTRLKLRPEEEFEVFEADVSETQAPA